MSQKTVKGSNTSLPSKSSDDSVNNVKCNDGSDDQYVTVITVSSYGEIQKPSKSSESNQPLTENPLYQPSHAFKAAKADNSAKELPENKATDNQNNISSEANAQNQGSNEFSKFYEYIKLLEFIDLKR